MTSSIPDQRRRADKGLKNGGLRVFGYLQRDSKE
jgi:hypothetical protein